MTEIRPRRSVLYMPGANERALEKAKSIDADALILDLEDSVSPDAKETGRANVCAAVTSGEYGHRELAIRVNSIGTQWHDDDVAAAAKAGPDAILVPKVESAQQVLDLVAAMEAAGAPESTQLWAMIETPKALLHAEEIAAAHERLTVIVMGTNDIVNETYGLHVPGRNPLVLTALSWTLLAVRAAGKVVIDGVYNDVKDAEGFVAEARQGREMGFDGKTLIHPSQVDPANEAFAPSEADIERARGMIAAFDEAAAQKKGVATFNGKMIEELHIRDAQRILAYAEALQGR
ncbi:HpcH/HpaI aldolase/citrate lyase family protein [Aeromicrobium duanguangcaii]|uniref:CoA ester lyase n=1 Tax=Aeromicrobium duanguangcaii TaxID=2968086 RepID=A0ABY5KH18_9ACTN|nr:CoA ester lyase [Aeromicrobium duanguangcaii]MCD9153619.1 CoA ester lyase [Aeromicrobium duanguangcaii]MCL3836396.1 CoA ester lyase [Aeromicrobium duanguangcaii]UUI69298.1 CoA ester lyase [Aeromicrobium duanguangcaii]